jgi:hypothetical protein
MDSRANQETEKQRNRARIAADLAEFLRRGGVIEELVNGASAESAHPQTHYYSPVGVGSFAGD